MASKMVAMMNVTMFPRFPQTKQMKCQCEIDACTSVLVKVRLTKWPTTSSPIDEQDGTELSYQCDDAVDSLIPIELSITMPRP